MRIVTWNVNGLRAALGKGFLDFCDTVEADVYCLQETKMQPGQAEVDLPGYEQYWNSAVKKGYSGTAVFTRVKPLSVAYDIDAEGHDTEGRSITVEYEDYYLVCEYTPNARNDDSGGLARIGYRLEWEAARRAYLSKLDRAKPVVLCGDLNVAHEEIDLKNPGPNRGHAGFSDEEREAFSALLGAGFADAFRRLYPDREGAYTWWSYRFGARANNAGWRIDYFVVSERLMPAVADVTILSEVTGSDHCPVLLDIRAT
ncbi:MAG: exodeoxyribonuclease III [Clostridiales Family XIII bacterium]|jgi:exodeoxyribonuclease-3|nr:exodeoxyribonuclease III [Clostridiales Family XIII bacterium]